MTIKNLKEALDAYELSEDTHVVIANLETNRRVEIVETWCDEKGVLNIIASDMEENDAGPISANLKNEVYASGLATTN